MKDDEDKNSQDDEEDDIKRLQRAINTAGVTLPFNIQTAKGCARLSEFADEISWVCTWRETFTELQSSGHAEETAVWLAKVKALANELAGKLEKPPGNMAVVPWDKDKPFKETIEEATILKRIANDLSKLSKILESLELFAKKNKMLGRPPIKKEKGWSPTDQFVSLMADIYEKYIEKRAYVERTGTEGKKGGSFMLFVQKVAKVFGGEAPSAEAIASALRKRQAKRR